MRLLLKHEIKRNIGTISILCGINILLYVILGIMVNCYSDAFIYQQLLGLVIGGLFGVSLSTMIFIIISIVKSFNNQLFSNEGYLTFVLPISLDKILISKYIINLLWLIMLILTNVLGILFLLITIKVLPSGIIFEALGEFGKLIIEHPLTALLYLVQAIVGTMLTFSTLLFTLVILNIGRIRKGKLIIGLILYSIVGNIVSFVSNMFVIIDLYIVDMQGKISVMSTKMMEEFVLENNSFILPVMSIFSFILQVGAVIGLYFAAKYLIKHKLELE